MRRNIDPSCSSESVKQFLRRRDIRFCGKTFRQHHQIQQSLVKKGFGVREIERLPGNPLWRLLLSAGNAANVPAKDIVQQQVSKTLNELGCRRRARQISVLIYGDQIIVDFIWRAGKGGVVTFN